MKFSFKFIPNILLLVILFCFVCLVGFFEIGSVWVALVYPELAIQNKLALNSEIHLSPTPECCD